MKTVPKIALLLLLGMFVSCEREEQSPTNGSIIEHKYLYKNVLYTAKFIELKNELVLIDGKDNKKLEEIFAIPTLNITNIADQDSLFYLFESLNESREYFANNPIATSGTRNKAKKSARTTRAGSYLTIWVDPWYGGGGLDLINTFVDFPSSGGSDYISQDTGLQNQVSSIDAYNNASGYAHLEMVFGDEYDVGTGRTFGILLGPQQTLNGHHRYGDLRNYKLCNLCFNTWNDRISSYSYQWVNYGPRG